MSFGKRLKEKRLALNLSVSFIANEIGVSASTYSDWENGRQIRGEEHYIKICEALSISLTELITGKKNIKLEQSLIAIENIVKTIRIST